MTQAVESTDIQERAVEFVPFGAADKIRLSIAMVKSLIAVPTKQGHLPSDRDCMKFLMLCRGKRANPFEGDCYMVGYDTKDGPQFSMISGVDLFLKRAEQSDDYDGYESGVIVQKQNGEVENRNGCIVLGGENLIAGWCNVYRKGRSKPTSVTADFRVYNTGRSRWEKDPGGMIEKVAISQALRRAYPTALGGFYTAEEFSDTGDLLSSTTSREPIAMPTPKAEEPQEPEPADIVAQIGELARQLPDLARYDEIVAQVQKRTKQGDSDATKWDETAQAALVVELKKAVAA